MKSRTIHGHNRRDAGASPTHVSWNKMKTRCSSPNDDNYRSYGGRGIEVCERWQSFENFLADMGERPEGTSLDRVDVDGNYEPSNCRWATRREQCRNKRDTFRVTYGGADTNLADLADRLKIKRDTLRQRIVAGWPEDRLGDPPDKNRYVMPRKAACPSAPG